LGTGEQAPVTGLFGPQVAAQRVLSNKIEI